MSYCKTKRKIIFKNFKKKEEQQEQIKNKFVCVLHTNKKIGVKQNNFNSTN